MTATPRITEGELDYHVPAAGVPCKTWYRIYGELKPSTIPLICMHGGPGATSTYLHTPMQNLSAQFDTTVIVYDQLGCGNSTRLRHKAGDTTFFTADLFVNELNNLLQKLSIKTYDLYGQSWGGMLGSYIASSKPDGLRKLVISNSPAKMSDWLDSCNQWRAELPKEVNEVLLRHEKAGTYHDPEYKRACTIFYEKHVCRSLPWADEVQKSFDDLESDPTVYETMNGPTEFHVIGPLKDWDTSEKCKSIEADTLIISARWDEGKEFVAAPFFRNIKRCKWVVMEDSSHMSMWEEPERYNRVLGEFLGY
jgi:proline-specific peptidase